ncbi:hypothetical protein PV325_009732 [Microctonus aethiopoides]|nr:hypothetical protein PV325_009732 [Microctonus aethiopoides]
MSNGVRASSRSERREKKSPDKERREMLERWVDSRLFDNKYIFESRQGSDLCGMKKKIFRWDDSRQASVGKSSRKKNKVGVGIGEKDDGGDDDDDDDDDDEEEAKI